MLVLAWGTSLSGFWVAGILVSIPVLVSGMGVSVFGSGFCLVSKLWYFDFDFEFGGARLILNRNSRGSLSRRDKPVSA